MARSLIKMDLAYDRIVISMQSNIDQVQT